MKRNQQLWRFVAPSLFIFLLVGGCVTKGRFEAQLAETQSLSERLQDQARKRAELEEEIMKLKRRLGVTESDLAETKKSAADQETTLNNRITVLEKQLALAKDMGSKTEKELKRKMIQMKGEFERDLQKRNQEISILEARLADQTQESLKFQDRLVDREQEIAKLQGALVNGKKEISELQNSLNEQFSKISKLEGELEKMAEIVDRVRDRFQITQEETARKARELRESDEARAALIDKLQKEIAEGSIKISQIKDRLTVEIVDKVLFASGSDRITKNGKDVLKKVSVVLKEVKENDIRIEGHTDNVPIGPKIIDKFPTNWELSTSRATQVVRYLIDQNVDPKNLTAMGLSKFRPVAPNDSEEGKQRNRRIEVVLFPRDIQKIAKAADR